MNVPSTISQQEAAVTKAHLDRVARHPLFGTVTLLIGSTALLLAAQPSVAADFRSITVSTAGTSLAGDTMKSRILRAARQVCAADDVRNLRSRSSEKACVAMAIASARVQLAHIIASRPLYAALDATKSPSVVSPEDEKSS